VSVLLTNGGGCKALVAARSLGKSGVEVFSCDESRLAPTSFSRYCKKSFITPSPARDEDGFISGLGEICEKEGIQVVMPMNSVETLLLSKRRRDLPKDVLFPFVEYEKMLEVHDKGRLSKLAEKLAIKIPKTHTVESESDLGDVMIEISYPAVVKLRRGTSSRGVVYVRSDEELKKEFWNMVKTNDLCEDEYPIIQEYVKGTGYGVSVLINNGNLRASFTHKRLREYPTSGGPSTCRMSVRMPEMEMVAKDLLESIKWHGLAMVEFKLDQDSNKPILIEVNPRFWGSIYMATTSGVNFPYLLYKLALGENVEDVLSYKLGVKTRYLYNDIRSFVSLLLGGRLDLSFFNFWGRNQFFDEWDVLDPVPPFVMPVFELKELVKGYVR